MSLYHISGPNDVQIAADRSKGQDVTVVYERLTQQSTCQVSEIDPVKVSGIGSIDFSSYDTTPVGSIPSGGILPMGRQQVGGKTADLGTLIPGVHYVLDGKPYTMPAAGSRAVLPQNLVIEYPEVFNGKRVPLNLPKPVAVGSKLILLPKAPFAGFDMWYWGDFLTRVLYTLVLSHGNGWVKGLEEFKSLVVGDIDIDGYFDYITGNPQYLPGVEFAPEGVRYFASADKSEPLYFPKARNTMSIDEMRDLPPLQIPNGLTVVYPERWRGVPIPDWMPKPVMVSGRLQLMPKNNAVYATDPLRKDSFFWLTFLTSVMMPLVSSFAQFPYNTKNEKLSGRILLDLDDRDIEDYLQPPQKTGTFVGNLFRSVWEIVKDGAAIALKIVAAGPRSAFIGLVRLNVKGFATNMKANLDNSEKRQKMLDDWKQLGGTAGDLMDAIEDGSKKDRILGPNCNCGTIGEPITVAAAITAAAPIIAALAAWLKGQVPEASAAIDLAVNELNRYLEDAGYDPLGFGNNWDKEVVVKNPNTGQDETIPPAPPADSGAGLWDLIRANPVPAALLAIAVVGVATDGFKFK